MLESKGLLLLSEQEFAVLARFIESHLGIKMPISKIIMLQSRLQGRLKALGFTNYQDYIGYVFSGGPEAGEELIKLIDAVTTNKTDFFRESDHFERLRGSILFELLKYADDLKIWSAGCSTGEEAYSLCIALEEFMRSNGIAFNYSVVGSDISSRVLETAKLAVYPAAAVGRLPFELKRRYFLKSKDPRNELVRVKPEIRAHTQFNRLNFMDKTFVLPYNFHIIFCRNVIIYFDKKTQESFINKLCKHLMAGGYLFLGHSETIMGMKLPLQNIAPTIYKRI